MSRLLLGVLALQGDFAEHLQAFADIGIEAVPVKRPGEVLACDGLVIPGGESTTIGKLCERFGVGDAILELHRRGVPIWGTCAGLILLAKEIVASDQWRLGILDAEVARNAFGRQVDSFEADLPMDGIPGPPIRAVFIRAPYVTRVWGDTTILAALQDRIVAVREGNLLGTAFHPELTDDRRVQEYFVGMVEAARQAREQGQ
ncbi:MAG: pyridoxal 5'-phosphate synthase glutaminase subunit PdxT [Armatimonadetes bacterium]|nr:pyridoxal 5'-phosphate synthase glutaminase subunit PdxT [Armatimonadota bacterium]